LREILSLKEQDSRIKAITFTRNFGQMAAMLAGFKEATGDAVINISADLQDPVELIPQMVEKWIGAPRLLFATVMIDQTVSLQDLLTAGLWRVAFIFATDSAGRFRFCVDG